jgi:hypothetical protein
MSQELQFRNAAASLCVLAGTLLAACESAPPLSKERRVEFAEEAASVYVSAYPAVPWAAIADKMEPKFNLSSADARKMAAVSTQAQVDQFLSTFSASLGIALPSRTRSSLATTAEGTTVSTSTRTLAPPSIPAGSTPSSAISDTALAADLGKAPLASGLDAATELQVGTGVYQLAQILDNQITKSITPKGYDAHLVTFQVNLQPTGRNLPYDAYVNVTLMPGSWQQAVALTKEYAKTPDGLPPVLVYPLVISDAMESSNVGRSIEVVRQAALQLSGIVSNVGIGAGIGGGSDRLSSILGSDRNSLVTVGRISDHTFRIRLGAANQGSTQLAIVPRTQNVSVVVFTRTDGTAGPQHIDKLAVITETRLVDVDTGKALVSRRSGIDGRRKLREDVLSTLAAYQYGLSTDCNATEFAPLDILTAVDRGDYAHVTSCLVEQSRSSQATQEQVVPSAAASAPLVSGIKLSTARILPQGGAPAEIEPNSGREANLRRMIARLMTLQAESRYSKMMVELSRFKSSDVSLPDAGQFLSMSDDGKAAAVTLRGGANLKAADLRATMSVKHKVGTDTKTFVLLPTDLTVANAGKDVSLTFPSLTAAQLMSTLVNGTPTHHSMKLQAMEGGAEKGSATYTIRLAPQEKSQEKAVAGPLTLSSPVIVAGRNGRGTLHVTVGKWDAKKAGDLLIQIQGADLRKVEGGKLDPENDAIAVAGTSIVRLSLGNLQPSTPVSVQALAAGKLVGKPLTLVVDRSR